MDEANAEEEAPFAATHECANGTKQTSRRHQSMSAFGGKADIGWRRFLSRPVSHSFYALWHAGIAYVLLRDSEQVERLGSELTKLADEHELEYWQALGDFLRGWRATQVGHAPVAIALLNAACSVGRIQAPRLFGRSYFHSLLMLMRLLNNRDMPAAIWRRR
jgi:hypothetical protein